MTKERELLRRALEVLEEMDAGLESEFGTPFSTWRPPLIIKDIRAYLNQSEIPTGCIPSDDAEEPVYLARRKGLDDFFTCSKERYDELSALDLFETKIAFLHPPKPAEPEAEYDLSQVIPLTHRKAKGIIQDKNFYITGFVLTQEYGDKCVVDMSAVRWLTGKEFFEMMHPLVVSPTADPAARKPIDHQIVLEKAISLKFRTPDPMSAFFSGVNFAEKHHEIGEDD